MALASLMVAKHRALVSRVTREQMALASLMDLVASDSFQRSSIPSSQMALCLWASMDAMEANSSLWALLAFFHSSAASVGGVMLPDLVVTAMGEMVVGILLEILLPSWYSPGMKYPLAEGVPLTCEVEAKGRPLGLVFSVLSSWTHDQMCPVSLEIGDSLPPGSCCPLLPILGGGLMGAGYYSGREFANRWYLSVRFLWQGLRDVNFQVDGLASSKAYAIGQ